MLKNSMKEPVQLVEEYIASAPLHFQPMLQQLRSIILNAHTDIFEHLAYGMPAYKLNGKVLLYFALQKNHLGIYPTSSGVRFFTTLEKPFGFSKGSIRFPLKEPIPFSVIEQIVHFRVAENLSTK